MSLFVCPSLPLLFKILVTSSGTFSSQVKANGTVIATINVGIRIINYIVKSPPHDYPYLTWFDAKDTYLYVFVTIIGAAGMPLGLWLMSRINQNQFKMGLALLLFVNAVSMIVMGSVGLSQDQGLLVNGTEHSFKALYRMANMTN